MSVGTAARRAIRSRTFSGIQPTGVAHIGNYFGALQNWVKLQDAAVATGSETIYCIVDLHAMSMPYEAASLRRRSIETAAALMACGISPQHSILFCQSAVREHTELAWTLGCATPLGWLQRMTQYKSKGSRDKATAGLGLLSYPVLQVRGAIRRKPQVPREIASICLRLRTFFFMTLVTFLLARTSCSTSSLPGL